MLDIATSWFLVSLVRWAIELVQLFWCALHCVPVFTAHYHTDARD